MVLLLLYTEVLKLQNISFKDKSPHTLNIAYISLDGLLEEAVLPYCTVVSRSF